MISIADSEPILIVNLEPRWVPSPIQGMPASLYSAQPWAVDRNS